MAITLLDDPAQTAIVAETATQPTLRSRLTAQNTGRLQALAKRDNRIAGINALMSLGGVAVAAGIIVFEPAFTTGTRQTPICASAACRVAHQP